MSIDFERVTDRTVKSIAELADRAAQSKDKVSILNVPNDPFGTYLIVKNDGTYAEHAPPTPPRSSTLRSVDQVPDYVTSAIDRWNAQPAVYYQENDKGAIVQIPLMDSQLEQDRPIARVNLAYTPQFALLKAFAANHATAYKPQKEFMLLLRLKLCTCIDKDLLASTVKALGAYEAMEGARTLGNVSRGNEFLGKEIRAEMKSSAGEIPTDLFLQVRVFDDRSLMSTRQIHCKLEIDPTNGGKFALIPLADELENAIDQEMSGLGDMLRKAINGSILPRLTGPETTVEREPGTAIVPTPTRPYVPVFYGQF